MNNIQEERELIDKTTERVLDTIGKTKPVKHIRRSQILSAIAGAIGFALFIDGVLKLFENFSAWSSLLLGLVLMLATGLFLQNLNR